jgi:DNA polymerase I-like protein with 3'-5' exonuclease and polymerase domains
MAMIRCTEFLNDYNSKRRESRQIHLIMQVHDELVFSCPRGASWRTNAPVIKELMRLMEYGGVGIGIPTPVSCEYHTENWSVGESVDIMAI